MPRPKLLNLISSPIVLLCALPLCAANITLDTTHTSTVAASAIGEGSSGNSSSPVPSLPYTTTASLNIGAESSSTTPDLTTSDLSLAFSQIAIDPGSSDSGSADIFFIAGPKVQYTLSGSATSNDVDGDQIFASLYDQTTSTSIYNRSAASNTTITLTSAGGPTTGLLSTGDLYEFQANATLELPPATNSLSSFAATYFTLSGTTDLALTQVPEPPSATLLLATFAIGATLAAARFQRRRLPNT